LDEINALCDVKIILVYQGFQAGLKLRYLVTLAYLCLFNLYITWPY